jgi:tetratricopeptide (TPR) repeat protein
LSFPAAVHADDAVNPEEAANTLFIEATQLYAEAQGAEKTDTRRAVALYGDVQKKLRLIREEYPSTQMGIQLAEGQLRIGAYTALDFEQAVLRPLEKRSASERDPFSCAFFLIERIGDPEVQLGVLIDAARRYGAAGFSEESRGLLGEIEARTGAIADKGSRARTLITIAAAYAELGRADDGLRVLAGAQPVAAALDDPSDRAKVLYDIANAMAAAGAYDRAYGIASAMSNAAGKTMVLVALVDRYITDARQDDARRILNETYKVSVVIPDNYQRALGWCEIAERYFRIGDTQKAIEMLDGVNAWAQALTLKEYQLSVLGDLAAKYAGAGETQKALDILQQISHILEQIKDHTLKVENALKIADTYRRLGMPAKAGELLLFALGEAVLINDPFYRAASIAEIAGRYGSLGQYSRAMEIVQGIQEPVPKVIASLGIAKGLADEGNSDGAGALLAAARTDAAGVKDQNARDALLIDIAERFAGEGRWQEAFETVALIGGKPGRALALSRIGSICAKTGYALKESEIGVLQRVMREAQQ